MFGLAAVSLLERRGSAWDVLASAGDNPPEQPGAPGAEVSVAVSDTFLLAGRGRELRAGERQVLEACAIPLVTGIARRRRDAADASAADEAWHRSRWTVLAATSREARNQIAAARQALTAIATGHSDNLAAQLATAWRALYRIDRLAADLGALGRLHAGALETFLRPVDLDEVFAAVLDDLGPGGHDVTLGSLEDVPDVIADAALLARILTSLLADSLARSSGAAPPSVTADSADAAVRIRITGCGMWTRPDPDGLPVRLARDLAEAMGGTLGCFIGDGGWSVAITLPAAAAGHRAA